jgi:malonyl-ACP O-methyltransferase BioC
MTDRKDRIKDSFAAQADVYDAAADLQWLVAERLAERITARIDGQPARILEIGCGTGFLSARLLQAFPQARLMLTDIAPTMLARCRARLGGHPEYRIMDGERPEGLPGGFDLIASNLAFQWFVDLPAGLERLAGLLAPGGRLMFATLGLDTFKEWRAAHERLGLPCGTPPYPSLDGFPWPGLPYIHHGAEEIILHPYDDGHDFVNSLKLLGASEPAPGHRPLSTGAFRRLLGEFPDAFEMSYHLIYGEVLA